MRATTRAVTRAHRIPLPVAMLAALAAGAGAQDARADRPAEHRFPPLRAEALSGRKYTLPDDLGGRANLVFVAFRREQQATVDTWLPYAGRLAAANPALRFYEMPTISRGYVVMSPIIARGMRGGVTDPAAREATITLYTDVRAFRRALGLPSDDTVYALLLDREGVVRWRSDGAFTPGKGEALEAAVAGLLADPAPGADTRG
jgi:hypothetical protein